MEDADARLMDQIIRGNLSLMRDGESPRGLNNASNRQCWISEGNGGVVTVVGFVFDKNTGQIHYHGHNPAHHVCEGTVSEGTFKLRRVGSLQQIIETSFPDTDPFVREVLDLSVSGYNANPVDIASQVSYRPAEKPTPRKGLLKRVLEYAGF